MQTLDKRINLVTLAVPIFMENFLRMMLNNVNVLMLSRYSDKAVAAVGVSNQFINLLLMIYGTLAFGTAVIIAQNLGAGNKETAAKTANVSITVNLALGLVLSLGVAIFAKSILRVMNLPDELMKFALPYLTIVSAASFCQALISAMSAIARNYGHTKISMFVVLGMNIINITGNCIVVFRPFGLPDFGVYGIAASTVISQIIAVVVMFSILFVKGSVGLHFSIPRPFPFDTMKKIFKIGVPGGGDAFFFTAALIVSTYFVAKLGTNSLTAMAYLQNLIAFIQVLGFSIGQATQIMVGHMIGAGEETKAYKLVYKSLWKAMGFNYMVAIFEFIFCRQLAGIFTDNQAIIDIVAAVFVVDLFLEPGRAFNLVIGNSLRGTGDVKWPVIASILSLWIISVPLGYILGVYFKLGLPGIYMAFAADEWVRGQLMHLRWRSRAWVNMRVVTPANKQLPAKECEYAQ